MVRLWMGPDHEKLYPKQNTASHRQPPPSPQAHHELRVPSAISPRGGRVIWGRLCAEPRTLTECKRDRNQKARPPCYGARPSSPANHGVREISEHIHCNIGSHGTRTGSGGQSYYHSLEQPPSLPDGSNHASLLSYTFKVIHIACPWVG